MRVLFDTNVILDVLLDRQPHARTAAVLMSFVDVGRLEGVMCATTVTTLYYLMSKAIGRAGAMKHMKVLMGMFDVAGVDRAVLAQAMDSKIADFEDAVVHEAARAAGATAIVTRNAKDFARASLPVLHPDELLTSISVR